MSQSNVNIIRQSVGTYKLKDQPGKDQYSIKNDAEEFMVLTEIRFKKVPGSNKFEVILYYPEPEAVEVSWKEVIEKPED